MISFGTDGIRGVANAELTPELALALGVAYMNIVGPGSDVLIARDTRVSGTMLSAALAAGLASGGANVIDVGVMPTGSLAFLCSHMAVPGAVISASHNPYLDNGIKIFGAGGRKLTDQEESDLERLLIEVTSSGARGRSSDVGTIVSRDLSRLYIGHVEEVVERRFTEGIKVAVDFANGAAFPIAKDLLDTLGCDVVASLGNFPDGYNINKGVGSTAPHVLADLVLQSKADVGLAFDGDADRLIAVSNLGAVIDGDDLLALFALDMSDRGVLAKDALAVTVMSNMGLELFLKDKGIACFRTNVGDRYVLEAMEEHSLTLGGEQSGHIIFSQYATTGDGLLSAALLLELLGRKGIRFSDLLQGSFQRYPQVLNNLSIDHGKEVVNLQEVSDAISELSDALGDRGRILVRPSGTEPVVRIMVEALTQELAEQLAKEIEEIIRSVTRK